MNKNFEIFKNYDVVFSLWKFKIINFLLIWAGQVPNSGMLCSWKVRFEIFLQLNKFYFCISMLPSKWPCSEKFNLNALSIIKKAKPLSGIKSCYNNKQSNSLLILRYPQHDLVIYFGLDWGRTWHFGCQNFF